MSATARLMAFLGMDAAGFTKGVDQAERRTHGFGKTLDGMKGKLAAAFTVGAAVSAVKDIVSSAGDLMHVAENLRITTDEYQALTSAAKKLGLASEDVEGALLKVSKAQEEAAGAGGSKEMISNFEKLGISLHDLDTLDPAEIFEKMSQGAQKGSTELSALESILGKAGAKFRSFSEVVAETGLLKMIKNAEEAGKLQTVQEIEALHQLELKAESMTTKAKKMMARGVGTALVELTGMGADAEKKKRSNQEAANIAAREKLDKENAAKIEGEAAEIRKKTAYDLLSKENKLLQLKKEQFEIDKAMAAAKSYTAKAELDKQRAELEAKIANLEKEKEVTHTRDYDQFRRIGGGIIGQDVGNQNAIKARMLGLQSGPIRHTATEQESMKTRDMLLQIKRMVTLHERTNTILEHTKSGVY